MNIRHRRQADSPALPRELSQKPEEPVVPIAAPPPAAKKPIIGPTASDLVGNKTYRIDPGQQLLVLMPDGTLIDIGTIDVVSMSPSGFPSARTYNVRSIKPFNETWIAGRLDASWPSRRP